MIWARSARQASSRWSGIRRRPRLLSHTPRRGIQRRYPQGSAGMMQRCAAKLQQFLSVGLFRDGEEIEIGVGIRLAAIERPAQKSRAHAQVGFKRLHHMFEQRELGEFL